MRTSTYLSAMTVVHREVQRPWFTEFVPSIKHPFTMSLSQIYYSPQVLSLYMLGQFTEAN